MQAAMTLFVLLLAGLNVACTSYASDRYERYGEPYRGYQRQNDYALISRAAHELENAAEHFYRQLRHDTGDRHLTRDARDFARAARHFHRQIERGGSYRHLRADYDRLARAFSHARQEFGDRHHLHHHEHFRYDFRAVARAFLSLQGTVHSVRNRSAYGYHDAPYGRDDYRHGGNRGTWRR